MTRFKKLLPFESDFIESRTILSGEQSFYLFLGGLLHVNDLELGPGLSSTLNSILGKNGLPVYTAVLRDEPNVGHFAEQMSDYHLTSTPTPEAISLVNDLFLPDSLVTNLAQLKEGARQEEISRHFRRFNLVGYSYGTSLIQQVEEVLEARLKDMNIPTDFLNNIGAVNIGPVAQPRAHILNGATIRIDSQNTVPDSTSLIKQLFVMGHTDKVSSGVIAENFSDKAGKPLSIFGNQDVSVIVDYSGDEMFRRAGVAIYPSGFKATKLDYYFEHEGHALRLYTNKLELQKKEDAAVICFPSKPFYPVLTTALQHMAKESLYGTSLTRKFQQAATNVAQGDLVDQFIQLKKEFGNVLQTYREMPFDEGLNMLDQRVKDFDKLAARYPQFI